MKNSKLSLADFKAKANQTETSEVLEKVQGGGLTDCHGESGRIGKLLIDTFYTW
ncbi:MAG: hypothetical protein PSN34_09465 [Urechidicola sp.]|nr:hypothetical protein [Urechidicola sp.]